MAHDPKTMILNADPRLRALAIVEEGSRRNPARKCITRMAPSPPGWRLAVGRPADIPAFPLMGTAPEDGHPVEYHGLSLRDYFAAAALTGILAFPGFGGADDALPRPAAELAYRCADAMLLAREKERS